MRNPIRRRRRGRPPRDLIAACIDGRCSGVFCPCLCHIESLHKGHNSLHKGHHGNGLQARRGRFRRISPWRRRGSLVLAGLLAASIGFAIIADPSIPVDSWLELGYGESNLEAPL
jgi:hypothetical protein